MNRKYPQFIFILCGILCIAFFLLATGYVWYGFWKNGKMKAVTEESLAVEKNSIPKQAPIIVLPAEAVTSTSANTMVTSTSNIVPIITTSTLPVKVHSTLRTAVSPLTGTLVLQEDDVNLNVPYTSQAPERNWSAPWQDACEEAAILMIDAYVRGYGLSPLSAKDEIIRMINWEDEQKMFTSIDAIGVQKIFTEYLHYKKPVKIIENPSLEEIKKILNEGKPILALAHGKTLGNKYYSNGGPNYHAFVIRGYTKDKFITNDPGVNRGVNFLFPIENVMKSLRDWNGGDVKSGKPVIIVVE